MVCLLLHFFLHGTEIFFANSDIFTRRAHSCIDFDKSIVKHVFVIDSICTIHVYIAMEQC